MEKQTQKNEVSTKANGGFQSPQNVKDDALGKTADAGVLLSAKDAEEFRAYKRRKRMTEVSTAIARSEASLLGGEDVQRVCERAARLKQAAVKLPISKLAQATYYLAGNKVKLDCVVGGNGETLAKVKAYETRMAVRRRAREITVPVTPSLLDCCRYSEIRRELKRVRRAAGRANIKVRVEKTNSLTALSRVARIACEIGAKYFSVPYFRGCERLRLDLTNGCQLEVSGVETTEDFRKMTEAGVGRIVTDHAWEIYSEWMKEASEMPIPVAPVLPAIPVPPEIKEENAENNGASLLPKPQETPSPVPALANPLSPAIVTGGKNPETEYCCRLEGSDLKFL